MSTAVRLYFSKVWYPEDWGYNSELCVNYLHENLARKSHNGNGGYSVASRMSGRCTHIDDEGRCRGRSAEDYRFCKRHLADDLHMYIAKSRHLAKLGLSGDGAYAVASTQELEFAGLDDLGAPATTNTVVFKSGKAVEEYGGEVLTDKECSDRYDCRETKKKVEGSAEYAIKAADDLIYDCISASSAVSYCNDPVDIKILREVCESNGLPMEKVYNEITDWNFCNANCYFALRKDARGQTVPVVTTIKTVRHGEELLCPYGASYWK